MRKILLFAIILGAFVFGFSSSVGAYVEQDSSNPVLEFVGDQTGISLQEIKHAQQVNNTSQNQEKGFFGKLVDFIGKFVRKVLPGSSDSEKEMIVNAELACVPKDVTPNEPVLLLWKCDTVNNSNPLVYVYDESGNVIESRSLESKIGSSEIYVDYYENPPLAYNFKLYCLQGKRLKDDQLEHVPNKEADAECSVSVINPQIIIEADKYTVSSGESVTLTWKATGVTSCELYSDSEANKDWKRTTTSGQTTTFDITQDTTFTLECQTQAMPVLESITINVE